MRHVFHIEECHLGKNTIIATSCMDARSYSEQPVWRHIADEQPALLLLLGDQIYMDGTSVWDTRRGGARARYKKPWLDAAGNSNMQQTIVDAFGKDMHERYAEQWAVASFRACVTQIRDSGGKVLLTWDDHDFAWNNSAGATGMPDKKVVPQPFKDMAYKLFVQFYNVVRFGDVATRYPALSQAVTPTAGLAAKFDLDVLPEAGVTVGLALLDGRTERQPHALGSAMIGATQAHSLQQAVAANSGLLIVASGSPLTRSGVGADVSWWQGGTASVTELQPFLNAAQTKRRPVIYIGGDIHSNRFIGFPFAEVPVYEVLASGAAKHQNEGNYVRISVTASTVRLDSRVLTQKGSGVATVGTRNLSLPTWLSSEQSLAGEIAEQSPTERISHTPDFDESNPLNPEQLRMMNDFQAEQSQVAKQELRSFNQAVFRKLNNGIVAGANDLALLSDAFIDELPSTPNYYSVEHDETSAGATFAVGETTTVRRAALREVMKADAPNDTPLVIYVHGFNNSFYDSLIRARKLETLYGLRSSGASPRPGIFTFSWPAGKLCSVFDAPAEFDQAMDRLPDAAESFVALLNDVAAVKATLLNSRPLVLLVRSTGAWLLETAVLTGGLAVADRIHNLFKCLVLSQPLTDAKTHKDWMDVINLPTFITINTNDSVLRSAQQLHPVNRPLGCTIPGRNLLASQAMYLDTTKATLVLSAHDVILRDLQQGKYRDKSLFDFHQLALHGESPRDALLSYGAFAPVVGYNGQLWAPLPMQNTQGAA